MGLRCARLLLLSTVWFSLAQADTESRSKYTTRFYFDQKALVNSRVGPGGLAYVPKQVLAGAEVPVVVFFHGLNAEGKAFPSFDESEHDVRMLAQSLIDRGETEPFVVLAPTHTRDATGAASLFHDFQLDSFVQSAQDVLGNRALLNRKRVILLGHSAGGCNPKSGMLGEYPDIYGIVAADTCLNSETTARLMQRANTVNVRIYAEASWQRPFDSVERLCRAHEHCAFRLLTLGGKNPHRAMVRQSMDDALPRLLAARKPASESGSMTMTGGEGLEGAP
jgi:poly(3-hydroxybutyrate) depolymerase